MYQGTVLASSAASVDGLMRQFLQWIDRQPRSYEEVMAAWRTSCPRLSVWEDAVDAGWVCVEARATMQKAIVKLTERGAAVAGIDRVQELRPT